MRSRVPMIARPSDAPDPFDKVCRKIPITGRKRKRQRGAGLKLPGKTSHAGYNRRLPFARLPVHECDQRGERAQTVLAGRFARFGLSPYRTLRNFLSSEDKFTASSKSGRKR